MKRVKDSSYLDLDQLNGNLTEKEANNIYLKRMDRQIRRLRKSEDGYKTNLGLDLSHLKSNTSFSTSQEVIYVSKILLAFSYKITRFGSNQKINSLSTYLS
jgi:hypothetical protein